VDGALGSLRVAAADQATNLGEGTTELSSGHFRELLKKQAL